MVTVAARETLKRFSSSGNDACPLTSDQLRFAGAVVKVANVSFYHGGDELYELEELLGRGTRRVSCRELRANCFMSFFPDAGTVT